MRSREEFVQHWEQELQSILFRGYVTQERDPAMLFRKMCNETRTLRDAIGRMWAELHPEPPPAKPAANGAPAQPQQKAVK